MVNDAKEFANVVSNACPNINVLYLEKSQSDEMARQLQKNWIDNPPSIIENIRKYFEYSVSAKEL